MEEEKIIPASEAENSIQAEAETPATEAATQEVVADSAVTEEPVATQASEPIKEESVATEVIAEEPVVEATESVGSENNPPADEAVAVEAPQPTASDETPANEEEVFAEQQHTETAADSTQADSTHQDDAFSEEEPTIAASQFSPRQKRPREKFVLKKWMVIVASIVAGFFISGLILGLVPHRAMTRSGFEDWMFVRIFDAQDPESPMVEISRDATDAQNVEFKRLFNQGMRSTRHSALTSLFEFNYVNSLRFRTREVIDYVNEYDEYDHIVLDEETGHPVRTQVRTTERVEVNARDVVSRTQSRSGTYVIEFVFATQGTPVEQLPSVRVRDNSTAASGNRSVNVHFDTIRILVRDTGANQIEEHEMFLFNSDDARNTNPESQDVMVTPVLIRMNAASLYNRLTDIREEVRGDRDNGTHVEPPTDGDNNNDGTDDYNPEIG